MAEGGLVSRPTYALIGESGPEAVVPLDRMGGGGSFNFSGNVIINLPAGAEGGGSGMEMGTTAAQGFWAEMKRFLEATGYAVGAGTTT
jgi:hypothetical protein